MTEQEELQRDREWLGTVQTPDLLDMFYDLSQGSTESWWESTDEIPF